MENNRIIDSSAKSCSLKQKRIFSNLESFNNNSYKKSDVEYSILNKKLMRQAKKYDTELIKDYVDYTKYNNNDVKMACVQERIEELKLNYIKRMKNEMDKYKNQINSELIYSDCNDCCDKQIL